MCPISQLLYQQTVWTVLLLLLYIMCTHNNMCMHFRKELEANKIAATQIPYTSSFVQLFIRSEPAPGVLVMEWFHLKLTYCCSLIANQPLWRRNSKLSVVIIPTSRCMVRVRIEDKFLQYVGGQAFGERKPVIIFNVLECYGCFNDMPLRETN